MADKILDQLIRQGVIVPHPASVRLAPDVNPDRIAAGATLHPGTRLSGADTSLASGAEVGGETPATIENCQVGRGAELKGGYFSGATFLDGANVGSGAHIRPGTLLEEEAGGAHAVGLKQTVLLPFVTLGSLINFCDCLMAGGTSRKDHSEVGSSYIHFNYTPHQDKATASLVGDVPRGVFLDQKPIFLGGQGGLVGPRRIEYGCTIPAGVVCRHDAPTPGLLLYPPASLERKAVAYDASVYGRIERVVQNNLIYAGNIRALQEWYRVVRAGFMNRDIYDAACHAGALAQLETILKERIKRMGELAEKLPASIEILKRDAAKNARALAQQTSFHAAWPVIKERLSKLEAPAAGEGDRERLLAAIESAGERDYIKCVRALPAEAKAAGTRWLQGIVDSAATAWQSAASS